MLILVLAGCSVPLDNQGGGLTFGYARLGPGARQVETRVPGLDLRFGTPHDGINLGWSQVLLAEATPAATNPVQTVSSPAVAATHSTATRHFAPPLGWIVEQDGTERRYGWFFWRRPTSPTVPARFIATSQAGLTLNLSPHDQGLGLGFARQTWTLVPAHTSGAWQLRFQSADAQALHFEALTLNPLPPTIP
jgi:hypothetical protein